MTIEFDEDFQFEYGLVTKVAPGIRRIVARNPGPFTGPGTGTYIIGEEKLAVIDPGPMIPEHIDDLLDGIGSAQITHILVTHTHADHSPAARILQQRTGAPTYGFGPHGKATAGDLEGGVDRDFAPDMPLVDGDRIEGENWAVEVIHTPGHCSNHICFYCPQFEAMFCGDQLMAWSTPVILPPDGSVAAYLDSLERLLAFSQVRFYPTHGKPIDRPAKLIEQFKQHRLQRVKQVQNELASGNTNVSDIRRKLYPTIPASLYAGAELSIVASLQYIEMQNKVSPIVDPGTV